MVRYPILRAAFGSVLAALAMAGCATEEPMLPPLRPALPARSVEEVATALPGEWQIDVRASAEVMARTQFLPREARLAPGMGADPSARRATMVAERFDPRAYREARSYWSGVLDKPDMQWRLRFNPDGTGAHIAVVQTGQEPAATEFKWQLDGYLLRLTYPEGARFKSFEAEAQSAVELHYPMQPLGEYLVLRRTGK